MLRPRYQPDTDRLSVLAATILLAYAVARFVELPSRELAVQLPGIYLSVLVDVDTFTALLVAGLTATGADWLLRDHPALGNQKTTEHWLLPALTAWVIGLPLSQTNTGAAWWLSFALGGGLLMLVLVAEYIAVDPTDVRHAGAAAGLIAVSFALFMALAVSLRFAGIRLFLIIPALTLACGLVSLRSNHLRLRGRWAVAQALVTALLIGQMAAALYYWPLTPIEYGLALLGPAYGLTSFQASLLEGMPVRRAVLEPVIVLLVVWGAALLL